MSERRPFAGAPEAPRPIVASSEPEQVEWEVWTPDGFPHVSGRYTKRRWDPELRMFEEQRVVMKCTTCGAEHKLGCSSGHVRRHIVTFATVHAHKDPLDAPVVRRPGSLFRPREE